MQQSLMFSATRQVRRVIFPLVDAVLVAIVTILLGATGTLQVLGPDDAQAAGIMVLAERR